jgi:hypothetical protein
VIYADPSSLQAKVDRYMADYNRRTREEEEKAKATEVDEDGFTLVKAGTMDGNFCALLLSFIQCG